MSDPIQEHADLIAMREFVNSVVQSLEVLSTRNRAYSEVIRTLPNAAGLMAQVQQKETTLSHDEPQKYIDLLHRTIQALEGRSLHELAPLGREVQARVHVWGKA